MSKIWNHNQRREEVPRNGAGILTYGRNFWLKTGHCRRCENGLGHMLHRRGAGGEHPSGVILQNASGILSKHIYEDEIAPDEKRKLRRQVRQAGKREVRRIIMNEVYT